MVAKVLSKTFLEHFLYADHNPSKIYKVVYAVCVFSKFLSRVTIYSPRIEFMQKMKMHPLLLVIGEIKLLRRNRPGKK